MYPLAFLAPLWRWTFAWQAWGLHGGLQGLWCTLWRFWFAAAAGLLRGRRGAWWAGLVTARALVGSDVRFGFLGPLWRWTFAWQALVDCKGSDLRLGVFGHLSHAMRRCENFMLVFWRLAVYKLCPG